MAYTVWKGEKVGVFEDWSDVQPLVKGFRGAKFKRFDNFNEAKKAFEEGADKYVNSDVLKNIKAESLKEEALDDDALVCYGRFDEDELEVEVYILDPSTGVLIEGKRVSVFNANYNMAEFIALMEGFKLVCENGDYCHIKTLYTNNTASVNWARQKGCKENHKSSVSLEKAVLFYLAYFEVYPDKKMTFKKIPSCLKSSLLLSQFV